MLKQANVSFALHYPELRFVTLFNQCRRICFESFRFNLQTVYLSSSVIALVNCKTRSVLSD